MIIDTVGGRTLPGALLDNAAAIGAKPMLEYLGGVASYAEVATASRRIASYLRDKRIRAGDRVAVFVDHSPEFFVMWYGITLAGAVVVPVNTSNSTDEITYQLTHSGCVLLVADTARAEVATRLRDAVPGVAALRLVERFGMTGGSAELNVAMREAPVAADLPAPTPDDLAMITYTSGTTARPKGVMLSHGNLLLFSLNWSNALRYHRDDRLLHYFPLYHSNGGIALFGSPVLVGATLVLSSKFSASNFVRELAESRITITALNATHVKFLLATPPSPRDADHPTYRAHFALELDLERRQEFESRFGIRLVELYGLTEVGIVTCAPVDAAWTATAGFPVPGTEVELRDADGDPVPPGELGQIYCRPQSRYGLWLGYLDDGLARPRSVTDGWLETGDLGRMSADGCLTFVQRMNDMIKRSGYNVAPAEVERVLMDHPAVRECSVVGVPDEVREEAIVAFVVLAADTTPEDLLEHCAELLTHYKVPQRIQVLDAIPETFIGKVDKRALRTRAMAEGERAPDM